jgi:hypothetical protein
MIHMMVSWWPELRFGAAATGLSFTSLMAVPKTRRMMQTAAHTARYLWMCRAAIPWPVKIILGVAMLLKCLPVDFGSDETLTVIAILLLRVLRPGLATVCYRAAQMRA